MKDLLESKSAIICRSVQGAKEIFISLYYWNLFPPTQHHVTIARGWEMYYSVHYLMQHYLWSLTQPPFGPRTTLPVCHGVIALCLQSSRTEHILQSRDCPCPYLELLSPLTCSVPELNGWIEVRASCAHLFPSFVLASRCDAPSGFRSRLHTNKRRVDGPFN